MLEKIIETINGLKKVSIFVLHSDVREKRRKKFVEKIFKVELFDGKHETAEKEFFREIEDRRDSGSHRRCCYRILLMDDAT